MARFCGQPEEIHLSPASEVGYTGCINTNPSAEPTLKKPILPFAAPAYPVLRPTPACGPQWRHEVKFDGWRVQARKTGKEVLVLSRLGKRRHRLGTAAALPKTTAWREANQGRLEAIRNSPAYRVSVLRLRPVCGQIETLRHSEQQTPVTRIRHAAQQRAQFLGAAAEVFRV